MSRPLSPDTRLGVAIAAACSRHELTADPGQAVAEIIATAGDHDDILVREVGSWCGYYESSYNAILRGALLEAIPGSPLYVEEGRARRAAGAHATG
ncbi:hypothetical protein AB2L57_10815 [Microbacterium sp. HA-8]|uniref:hypothetical protein n=1 Tax=Microbacterium sp. HA-8 TaxID=3234200 RepID=UPI0038F6103D